MAYIDGTIIAVPTDKKAEYIKQAQIASALFKEYGATAVVDAWGDDVPEGKLTDFRRAVQQTADETVVFSWVTWPDKATRDAGWEQVMKDPRMAAMDMPFDGKRMIYGGFEVIST
jgi:uncharacterized protein YbaA (DUF1428 family)